MNMRYAISIVILLNSFLLFGQTPSGDQSWSVHFEDNFTSSQVNTSKWTFNPPWGNCDGGAHQTSSGGNHDLTTNGILSLVSKQENSTCRRWNGVEEDKNHTTGALISKESFRYGYFEIKCKIPELSNSNYTGKGFSPTFWLWPVEPDAYGNTSVTWSEIDFFEIDGENNLVTNNIHFNSSNLSNHWSLRNPSLSNIDENDFIANFSSFHTFGCEWTPNYISFYYDGKLIQTSYTEYANDLLPMNIYIGIATPAGNFGKNFEANSLFPYSFDIDYVKVYKLGMDCSKDVSQNQFSYPIFDNKVKRNIMVGGSSGQVPSSSSASFRATNSITLNDGFEVQIGSEFYANNCDCE
jgi:beta-glucanase (GH16 family)